MPRSYRELHYLRFCRYGLCGAELSSVITLRIAPFTLIDPQPVLDALEQERKMLLNRIEQPVGRAAARLASLMGYGPEELALNTAQIRHIKKKITN
jgi:hypothetical protein